MFDLKLISALLSVETFLREEVDESGWWIFHLLTDKTYSSQSIVGLQEWFREKGKNKNQHKNSNGWYAFEGIQLHKNTEI